MKTTEFDLDLPISQKEFARLVGLSEAAVSNLVSDGVLDRGASARQWLICYCGRLREVAAARRGLYVQRPS